MGFLLDTVDQKKLDTQREVVRNERRQTSRIRRTAAPRSAWSSSLPDPHRTSDT